MKLNVGILRGGSGPEYETSIRSGGQALLCLDRSKFRPVDLTLGDDGILYADGAPIEGKALRAIVDVVLNLMHGGAGEDGTVQKILNDLNVRQTGAGSRKIVDKILTKKELGGFGLRTPYGTTFSLPKQLDESLEDFVLTRAKYVFNRISPPWIVKPTFGGSSVDTYLARDFSELIAAIRQVLARHEHVLVEEYVRGREIHMGLIEGFRGEDDYFLLPAELKYEGGILGEEARRSGDYRILHPKDLADSDREVMRRFMIKAKEKLGLKDYFTADFVLTPFGIYLLEVDALPAIDEHAILPKSLEAVGSSLTEFLSHVINRAAE